MRRNKLQISWTPPYHLYKASHHFIKNKTTTRSSSPRSIKPRKINSKSLVTHHRNYRHRCLNFHMLTCTTVIVYAFTCARTLPCIDMRLAKEADIINDVTSHFHLDPVSWTGSKPLAKKKQKRKNKKEGRALTMDELWLWQKKVKIFKMDLSPLICCVRSDFRICFFIWDSEISQMVWFLENWLLHKF